MTNNTDAQIAREWAEKTSIREKITFGVDDETLAAARYILATTAPPTMADVKWDDEVHPGQCAEHPLYGEVRMIWEDAGDILFLYVEEGRLCYRWTDPANLTPIPDTKIDLTPRRKPVPGPVSGPVPESTPETEQPTVLTTEGDVKPDPQPGEAWLIEYNGKRYEAVYWYSPLYAHWAFVYNREGLKTVEYPEAEPVSRLEPKSTSEHPEFLETEEDYESAPVGTIITYGDDVAVKIEDDTWKWVGLKQAYNPYDLAAENGDFAPCTVVRWGK